MNPDNTNLSRRSLLVAGAGALAGLALAQSRLFAAEPVAADDYAGLPMGIQSYTFRDRSFENALKTIRKTLNLSRVEIYPGHLSGISPTKAKELLKEYDMTVTAYGVVHFSKDMESNRKTFEFAKGLGIPHLSCDPDPDSFDSLDKLTEEYKITADIHDHGPGHRWGKIQTILDALKDHSKMIGLCDDTGHFIRAGEDPLKAAEDFVGRLHAVHLKDFKKNEKGKFEDCALGDGGLQLKPFLDYLIGIKYEGDLSIEYEGGKPDEVVAGDLVRIKGDLAGQKPK
ncbi:MAG TPA: sugar phosphate isomerase/epimerase [Tepidisphaeraceae bacterium]|nr:sugar phosphate isomerase/epimerase [Tepidisphaeraceae bacterium]